ncbi:hypothetical protein ABL78_5820 [Leptomonas seymouri]|uniref:Uncharacterized protein n=1 Tax=Leptomonas seymouri TaxID=5684 RepID=A0A0N0P4R6_LEPSE|nr:hypothetical protein ABL78_5820 [Leptomonas seymouri]|eukprot:KPI85127.1 hypothetical protein ABL78_5820 [Leptomonas seymouri]
MLPQSAPAQWRTDGRSVPLYATSQVLPSSVPSPPALFQASPLHAAPPGSPGSTVASLGLAPMQSTQRGGPGPSTQLNYSAASTYRASPAPLLVRSSMAASSGPLTHSATSASVPASRIGVRDVAELVRQLAESRYTARQLQQRMHQLEASAVADSITDKTKDTNASIGSSSGAVVSEEPIRAAQGQASNGDSHPQPPLHASATPQPVDSAETQQRRPRGAHGPRRRSAGHAHQRHSSKTRAPSWESFDADNGDALFSSSDAVSLSSALTSTSSFLPTSGPSSKEGSVADAYRTQARRRASASSSTDSSASSKRQRKPKRERRNQRRRAHAPQVANNDEHHRRAKLHLKRDTKSASSANAEGCSNSAQVRSSRHGKRQFSRHLAYHRPSRTASMRNTRDRAEKATQEFCDEASANPRESKRHHWWHDAQRREHRTLSAHRRHRPHSQRHPPQEHDTTSLAERRKREQEAKELKHARKWQRRYYDLMSKYADETARRDAELADIHDLIEYMSWEHDLDRHLHRTRTPTAVITDVHEGADAAADISKEGVKRHKTPAKRATEGAPPQRGARASMPKAAISAGEDTKDREGAPGVHDSSRPPSHLYCQDNFRHPLHAGVSAPPSNAADPARHTEPNNAPATEEEHDVGSSEAYRGRDAVLKSERGYNTLTVVSQTPATAEYVWVLRSEAEAWRLSGPELLQRQSEPSPACAGSVGASAQETSQAESVAPDGTPSFASMPPPLPPRPRQYSSHCHTERATYQPVDLVAGFDGSATARTWGEEYAKESVNEGAKGGFRREVYRGDEAAPLPNVGSTPTRSLSQHQRATASTNTSPPTHAMPSADLPMHSFTGSSGPSRSSAAAQQFHLYAPSPEQSASAFRAKDHRQPPAASAAAMHAPYFASEKLHRTPSPRPPLFVGLPDYRHADRCWYSPMRWSTVEAAVPPSSSPLAHEYFQQQQSSPPPPRPAWCAPDANTPVLTQVSGQQPTPLVPPSTPHGQEAAPTASSLSSAAAAELLVAREQLERDIRRHDQLLAAIGKLQKTASEHAAR